MSRKHLQRYVNEVAFRQNYRPANTLLTMDRLVDSTKGKRLSYKMLKKGEGVNNPRHSLYLSRRKQNAIRSKYPGVINNMIKLPDQLNPFVGDETED